ncbi:MAG: thioredoxin [Methanosarcinaceae archaeon]|nr:thioredoxin [Methanosarcinaceae archaeon]MDF1533097.1 thioredoxin [Methanosarcinaceae archaeon]
MNELEAIRKKKMEQIIKKKELEGYPDKPVIVTDADFNIFISKYPLVVVDCWAEWCGPCRMLAPTVDELATQYRGKIVFGKLDTDNNRATSMQYKISSIPAMLVFKNGNFVGQIIGAVPKEQIVKQLQPLM